MIDALPCAESALRGVRQFLPALSETDTEIGKVTHAVDDALAVIAAERAQTLKANYEGERMYRQWYERARYEAILTLAAPLLARLTTTNSYLPSVYIWRQIYNEYDKLRAAMDPAMWECLANLCQRSERKHGAPARMESLLQLDGNNEQ